MPDLEDIWVPLVDEPIGWIVRRIQAENPEIDQLVSTPRRVLAFRTFAYIRVGLVLGQLPHGVAERETDPDRREGEPGGKREPGGGAAGEAVRRAGRGGDEPEQQQGADGLRRLTGDGTHQAEEEKAEHRHGNTLRDGH